MVNVISEGGETPLNVADGEKVIVLGGVVFNVPTAFGVGLTGLLSLFRNFGTVQSHDRFGVLAEGAQVRIDNSETGLIESEYVGISASLGNSTISNSGAISGSYAAIEMSGSYSSVINNRGTLTGDYQGILVSDGSSEVRVNNYETIAATKAGSIGIKVEDGSFATKLLNIGEIVSEAFGIQNFGAASNIHNKGDITADIGIETRSDARFVNDGVITGSTAALIVNGPNTNANVTNRGDMVGEIKFDAGDDRFGNKGTIDGDIMMGAGDDKVHNTGEIVGHIAMGSGKDKYVGSNALAGADVSGGTGKDDLRGSDFDDVFDGGTGQDVIRSGGGADTLIGGGDRDILTGGAGADVFVYRDVDDSGALFDVVTDFEAGEDRIDLSVLSASAFVLSTEGLVGDGTASIYADEKANTNNYLNIDVDGDGFRDMLILLQRAGEVTTDDFIL